MVATGPGGRQETLDKSFILADSSRIVPLEPSTVSESKPSMGGILA
jgi:hypothetical protein